MQTQKNHIVLNHVTERVEEGKCMAKEMFIEKGETIRISSTISCNLFITMIPCNVGGEDTRENVKQLLMEYERGGEEIHFKLEVEDRYVDGCRGSQV